MCYLYEKTFNHMNHHKCQNLICNNKAEKDRYGNYRRYCCNECKFVSQRAKIRATMSGKDMNAILKKRELTNTERYGVPNVAQADFVKEKLSTTTKATADVRKIKTIETNLKNHGVESTNSLESVKYKKKLSLLEKHGVDHQLKIPGVAERVSKKNKENSKERLEKSRRTKAEKYGDENYNNRAKYIQSVRSRFGVDNPSQSKEVQEKKMKSEYRTKIYIFPSGRKERVMGYEGKALDELLNFYSENDIILGATNIPSFRYKGEDNKFHMYFPDIYIPKENLIIEVKSEYTFKGYIGWFVTNMLKKKACIDAGYNFKFMIMAKK